MDHSCMEEAGAQTAPEMIVTGDIWVYLSINWLLKYLSISKLVAWDRTKAQAETRGFPSECQMNRRLIQNTSIDCELFAGRHLQTLE